MEKIPLTIWTIQVDHLLKTREDPYVHLTKSLYIDLSLVSMDKLASNDSLGDQPESFFVVISKQELKHVDCRSVHPHSKGIFDRFLQG